MSRAAGEPPRHGNAHGRPRHEPGDLICGEGDYGGALYLVREGVTKLSVIRSEASEAILRLAGPWEVIRVPVPGWKPSRLTWVEAFTACEVVKVPRVFVERAVRENPVALKLTELLELELARREELFGCLLPRTTEARLARLLPILARQFGVARTGLDHRAAADPLRPRRDGGFHARIGYRRRELLPQAGVLEKGAGIIFILKPEVLAETAESWHGRAAPLMKRTLHPILPKRVPELAVEGLLDVRHPLDPLLLPGTPLHLRRIHLLDTSLNPREVAVRIPHPPHAIAPEQMGHLSHRCSPGFQRPSVHLIGILDVQAEEPGVSGHFTVASNAITTESPIRNSACRWSHPRCGPARSPPPQRRARQTR